MATYPKSMLAEEAKGLIPELDWSVEIDRASADQWSSMLDLFDDANIYQSAAYGGVRWGEKNLSRIVL